MNYNTMSSIQFDVGDNYDKECGKVFLTLKGNIVFHCTLCENKYTGFENFADHIVGIHYIKNVKQEILEEMEPEQLSYDANFTIKEELMDEDHLPGVQETDVNNASALKNKEPPTIQPTVTVKEELVDDEVLPAVQESIVNKAAAPKKKKPPPISELMIRLFQEEAEDISQTSSSNQTVIKEEEKTDKEIPTTHENNMENYESFEIQMEYSDSEISEQMDEQQAGTTQASNSNLMHKCLKCNIGFKDKVKFINHHKHCKLTKQSRLGASGALWYECADCGEQVSSHDNHICRRKNFVCDYCGKGFGTAIKLKEHRASFNNDPNRICTICQLTFETGAALHKHTSVHIKERNYKCDVCQASFKKKKSLVYHSATHENQTLYPCKLCEKRFQLKAGLKYHMRIQHLKTMDGASIPPDCIPIDLSLNSDIMISAALL